MSLSRQQRRVSLPATFGTKAAARRPFLNGAVNAVLWQYLSTHQFLSLTTGDMGCKQDLLENTVVFDVDKWVWNLIEDLIGQNKTVLLLIQSGLPGIGYLNRKLRSIRGSDGQPAIPNFNVQVLRKEEGIDNRWLARLLQSARYDFIISIIDTDLQQIVQNSLGMVGEVIFSHSSSAGCLDLSKIKQHIGFVDKSKLTEARLVPTDERNDDENHREEKNSSDWVGMLRNSSFAKYEHHPTAFDHVLGPISLSVHTDGTCVWYVFGENHYGPSLCRGAAVDSGSLSVGVDDFLLLNLKWLADKGEMADVFLEVPYVSKQKFTRFDDIEPRSDKAPGLVDLYQHLRDCIIRNAKSNCSVYPSRVHAVDVRNQEASLDIESFLSDSVNISSWSSFASFLQHAYSIVKQVAYASPADVMKEMNRTKVLRQLDGNSDASRIVKHFKTKILDSRPNADTMNELFKDIEYMRRSSTEHSSKIHNLKDFDMASLARIDADWAPLVDDWIAMWDRCMQHYALYTDAYCFARMDKFRKRGTTNFVCYAGNAHAENIRQALESIYGARQQYKTYDSGNRCLDVSDLPQPMFHPNF